MPVLDLHALLTSQPAEARFGTRLILVDAGASSSGASDGTNVLGLLAERATGTIRREEKDFVATGLRLTDSPHLGAVTADPEGFIQQIQLDGLLNGPVRELLRAPGTRPTLEDHRP